MNKGEEGREERERGIGSVSQRSSREDLRLGGVRADERQADALADFSV